MQYPFSSRARQGPPRGCNAADAMQPQVAEVAELPSCRVAGMVAWGRPQVPLLACSWLPDSASRAVFISISSAMFLRLGRWFFGLIWMRPG